MLSVLEEGTDSVGRYVFDQQAIDVLAYGAGHEWQQLGQGPAEGLRVAREIALSHQVLEEEAAHHGAKRAWSRITVLLTRLHLGILGEAYAGLIQQVGCHLQIPLGRAANREQAARGRRVPSR